MPPDERKFAIRIRSVRSKEIVQEICGTYAHVKDLESLAADIWNSNLCLGESHGLRVYRPIGKPMRWRKVDELGYR